MNLFSRNFSNRLFTVALVAALGLAACDSSEPEENAQLTLSFSNMEALDGGFHYEGWAMVDGNPISTGKFNLDASGNMVDLSGAMISGGSFDQSTDISGAAAVVITIEPAGDTDTIPSGTKLIGGDVSGGSSSLTAAHGSSLGNDFSSAAGSFILATPTAADADNPLSGIWFLDASSGSPMASLDLPTLPSGWVYEGWAVVNGSPVTTGTFDSPSGADSFGGFSGPNAGPPYPGEDFLVNAPAGQTFPVDLSGATAVISIEPSPDDSAAPFAFKPLVGNAPAAAAPGTSYDLGLNLGSFITGSATIR